MAKTGATYYTPERVEVAIGNVDTCEWAQDVSELIMKGQPYTYVVGRDYTSAEEYVEQSDDFMWKLQPPTTIPRIYPHEARAECPVHGIEVRKINAWHPWKLDPINHPYQLQCRMGQEWYPSNKYGDGDMTSGDYPDDGDGWVAPDGRHFFFIREYASACYTGVTIPTLQSLSKAYLLTGDEKFARKGAILLARVASEYPNHDDRKDRLWAAPYGGRHPHYEWKGGGMITDLIWETFCTEEAVLAYDAFYEYMGQDPELIEFLKSKGMPIEDADDLRKYIEHYLLRAAAVALQNGAIRGNEGFPQALAMTIALVLDDYEGEHPNSQDMVDWAYSGGGHSAYVLVNQLRRDGGGHESPNYNRIKQDFIKVARLMEEVRKLHPEKFPVEKYPDIFGNDKAKAMFDYFIDLKMNNFYTPSIGDNGGIRAPRRVEPEDWNYSFIGGASVYAFDKYGDPRFARAATRYDGSFYSGDLFETYPLEEMKAALETPASQIVPQPRLLDGYGVGILESGDDANRRAVCLNYAASVGHRQQDTLNLEVFARGVDILPDLGYPFTWDYTETFDCNIMAHNTVSVGQTRGDVRVREGNACTLFASKDGVHTVTAHHAPYPPDAGICKNAAEDVDLYERTVTLVDVDETRFYVVDLFAVDGGDQHDQSWHGPLVEPKVPALNWQAQPGTLAGPDVERYAEYTDKWGRTLIDFPSFVNDIRRASIDGPATWEWDYGLDGGDMLRLHVLPVGGAKEVIMGKGSHPRRPQDWGLDYLFVRDSVEDGARSLFVTVVDPYQNEPVVRSARIISEDPLQIEVTLADGVDVIHLAIADGPSETTEHRAQGVRVVSARNGEVWRDVQVGEYAPGEGPGYVADEITALDYETREIAIPYEDGREELFAPGQALRIFNEFRTAMFRIEAARVDGETLWLTIDTTALLQRGPFTGAADGVLDVAEYFMFANGHADDNGQLASTNGVYLRGSWIGEGDSAHMVKAGARITASSSKIFTEEPVSEEVLERDFSGKVLSVWQYGVGDQVELAIVE